MKRTHILLDQQDWTILQSLAKEKNTSIGGLIRFAVHKTYIADDKYKKRSAAIEKTLKNRAAIKDIDYKALIEDGRT